MAILFNHRIGQYLLTALTLITFINDNSVDAQFGTFMFPGVFNPYNSRPPPYLRPYPTPPPFSGPYPISSGVPSWSRPVYSQPAINSYRPLAPKSPARQCRINGDCKVLDHGTTLPTSWLVITTTTPAPTPAPMLVTTTIRPQ